MPSRALWISSLFALCIVTAQAQVIVEQKASCFSPACTDVPVTSNAPIFPSKPTNGKWEVEDYKRSKDASISCAIVKYQADNKPQVHLLCPGPEIYAPLRVYLALTWNEAKDVPSSLKNLQVDTNAAVRFKSRPGNPMAELTLRDAARSQKEWVSFNKINVSLVLEKAK
ncbi:MAG TPA: hypothetical protein VE783_11545 [Candidatus Limnocylindrales bacterium]|jgi:hypothetical protein|nr:hypothetical protein [Candidatus Limnocylindrales bacterium]